MAADDSTLTDTALLDSAARVPDHVAYRCFVAEAVVLNLQQGTYHGLNPVGAKMLETLRDSATVGDAAARLATAFGTPLEVVERDLCDFCRELAGRSLIEVHVSPR